MTSTSLHPTPSSQTVAREQFRSVGLAIRTEAFFFIGTLLLFTVLLISNAVHFAQTQHTPGSHMGFGYSVSGAVPMFLVGLLIPFGVWRSEDPSRRAYFWSMPIERGSQTIMKLLSGWAWLMLATGVYLLFIAAMATIVSMIVGEPAPLGTTPGWEWIAAFTATTLGYLLTSIAVIGSDHPWRWIGGVLIGYGVVMAVLSSFGMSEVARAFNEITNGRYGLNAALFGQTHHGQQGITIGMRSEEMLNLRESTWIVAMPLWIIGSAIAVTIASYRHHE